MVSADLAQAAAAATVAAGDPCSARRRTRRTYRRVQRGADLAARIIERDAATETREAPPGNVADEAHGDARARRRRWRSASTPDATPARRRASANRARSPCPRSRRIPRLPRAARSRLARSTRKSSAISQSLLAFDTSMSNLLAAAFRPATVLLNRLRRSGGIHRPARAARQPSRQHSSFTSSSACGGRPRRP